MNIKLYSFINGLNKIYLEKKKNLINHLILKKKI